MSRVGHFLVFFSRFFIFSLIFGIFVSSSNGLTVEKSTESLEKAIPSNVTMPTGITPPKTSDISVQGFGPIQYRGGAVMTRPTLYLLFYGNWTSLDKGIVENFAKNLGNHAWWKVQRKYYQLLNSDPMVLASPEHVGPLRFAASLSTGYLNGNVILNPSQTISKIITSFKLPKSDDGIYALLPSADVRVYSDPSKTSLFCKNWIGVHSSYRASPAKKLPVIDIKFVVVPHFQNCQSQWHNPSPNGRPGVDSMIDTLAHEIGETATDPYVSYDANVDFNAALGRYPAWFDDNGAESLDKCNNIYASAQRDSNGALYNMILGNRKYLVQDAWDPIVQSCVSFSR